MDTEKLVHVSSATHCQNLICKVKYYLCAKYYLYYYTVKYYLYYYIG